MENIHLLPFFYINLIEQPTKAIFNTTSIWTKMVNISMLEKLTIILFEKVEDYVLTCTCGKLLGRILQEKNTVAI